VKELPLDYVRWLVVAVILYTATAMWRSSMVAQPAAESVPAQPAPDLGASG
jgi:hypothetical protein